MSRLTTGGEPPSREPTAEDAERDDCILPSICGTCVLPGAPFKPNACECNKKVRTVQTPLPAVHRHAQGLAQEAGATLRSCSRPKSGAYGLQIYIRCCFPNKGVHSDCWLVCRSCCGPPSQDLRLVSSAGSNNYMIWSRVLNSSRSPNWAGGQLSLLAQASVLREVLRNLTQEVAAAAVSTSRACMYT